MRFSLITLAGLAALSGGNFGVNARAIPNDVDLVARAGTGQPVVPAPRPAPVIPKPTTPKPVTPKTPRPVGEPEGNTPGVSEVEIPAVGEWGRQPLKFTKPQVVGCNAAKRSISKRAYNKMDATDPKKVLAWLESQSTYGREKIVFFTGDAGAKMAENFVKENANNGWRHYHTIFAKEFKAAFDNVGMSEGVNQAASEALALYARHPVVFNHNSASSIGYWKLIELPNMWNAGSITKLKDNTLDPNDVDGSVELPEKPAGC